MILIMSANLVTVAILQLPSVRNVPQFKDKRIKFKISLSLSS